MFQLYFLGAIALAGGAFSIWVLSSAISTGSIWLRGQKFDRLVRPFGYWFATGSATVLLLFCSFVTIVIAAIALHQRSSG